MGIPLSVLRRLQYLTVRNITLTIGDGIYGATVIIYLMIVWTLSMWSDVSYTYGRYTCTMYFIWYDCLVYGTRFPMEHLTFSTLLSISILFECWFVLCTCPFMVTVPLLWTSTTLIWSCTQTLQLCFHMSLVLVRVRDLYVIFVHYFAHVHFISVC